MPNFVVISQIVDDVQYSNFMVLKRAAVSQHDMLYFYIGVICPVLEYAVAVWQSCLTAELSDQLETIQKLEMWANAQRDGRPAEYRWRPLFNAAKFG